MSSSKRQPAPKLQALMGKQAFEATLQAAGVGLEWRFTLFLIKFNKKAIKGNTLHSN